MAHTPKGTRGSSRQPARGTVRNTVSRLIGGTGLRQVRWLPPVAALAVAGLLIMGVVALVQASRGALSNGANSSGSDTTSSAQPAPDFALTTIDGSSFHLATQRGHAVVLYFMATGCGPCLPGSQNVAQAVQSSQVRGTQAVMIDLNDRDSAADLRAFAQGANIPASVPVVWGVDSDGGIATAYGVQTLETTAVIDAQGRIAYRSDGPVPTTQLAQVLKGLPRGAP